MRAADELIVLVGGQGTRLRSVISEVPKPLAPVAGRPFLAWVMDEAAKNRFRRCILACGYMADAVLSTIGEKWMGMEVVYSIESEPLGTGGALRRAAKELSGTCVHVQNGDTFVRHDPARLEELVRCEDAMLGLVLAEVDDAGRYGSVEMQGTRLRAFSEKSEHQSRLVNAGCYFLSETALRKLPDRLAFSFENDVLIPWTNDGRVVALAESSNFIDIGIPVDYMKAQEVFGASS